MKYSMLVVAMCLLLEPTWGQDLLRRPLGSRPQRPVAAQSADVGKETIKVIPTAREGGTIWKYKESDKPLANWGDLSFDDKDWQEGTSGFGNSYGLRRTAWTGGANDLYLRKTFKISSTTGQIERVSLTYAIDDDIEVLLNGSQLFSLKARRAAKYGFTDVTKEFKCLLRDSGQDNVLAVKAHDEGGNAYVDVGLDIVLADSATTAKKDALVSAEKSAETQGVACVSEIALIPFGGTDWKYKMQGEVEENWKSPDFNDACWLKGNSSFGSGGRYEVCTRWTTPCVCLRKKFDCPYEDTDIKYLQIREEIDNMVDVWLNGSHIYHWQFCGNCDMTTVIPRQLWEGLLRRKDNVLTVVARDWGGPRIVNVGLTAMVRQSVGKELVCPTEYVPADMKLIFPATKLADIQVCSAVLTGDAVNWGRPTAVLANNIKSFGDLRKTLQFQRLEVGCLKCACVELEQKGRDVWGRVLYCRSVEHCDVSGVDFDTLLCPTHRIIDNDLELSNQPSCGIALRELTAYFGALAGPYGIRMDVAPGCEKGAEYVLGRLRDDWLPRSLRYYGDPFVGKTPSRVYTIKVRRNDGGGKSKYTGPSGFFGFGCGNIGLAKDSDKYEFALDWLAASVLTVCEEPNSSSFQQYVKRFLEGEAKGQDPILQIKKDVQDGLVLEGADRRKKYPYMHTSMWAVFEELREKHPKFIQEYYQLKNSRFAEGRLPEKLSFDQVAGLLSEVTHENVTELFKKYGIGADPSKGPSANGASRVSDKAAQGKIVVADKLQSCDFLLNKDFKKNAKFYLCLFSASWCGPCRREMPRIAKTYAETLKDDPDIELIHFSRDQNDEKALAWAKEHDVKFPVVKPNGGNPLDLHSRGIPHLFIVKADGTLVEEGHPMRIFNEEKFKELKSK